MHFKKLSATLVAMSGIQEAKVVEELHHAVAVRECVPQPGPAQGIRHPPHS